MKREEKEIQDITLKKLKQKHIDEFEKNLTALKKVRDMADDMTCPHCKKPIELSQVGRDKNRIEAAKAIARHIDALQPERVGKEDPPAPDMDKPTPEGKKRIDEYLSSLVPSGNRAQ